MQSERCEEIEANGFAAELLMPTAMLERDLAGTDPDYEDDGLTRWLADRYKVSLQAMVIRLVNLESSHDLGRIVR